jgi:hypothetical protein
VIGSELFEWKIVDGCSRVSASVGLSGNVGKFDLAVILEGMFKSMDSRWTQDTAHNV